MLDVPFDAIVLAGGLASRLGGADKPGLALGDETLLDRVLRAVDGAEHRVLVGPTRSTIGGVVWCREDPPGGGPLAGLAAGLPLTTASLVVTVGADLPWIGPAVPLLIGAVRDSPADAAVLVDRSGRSNLLAAAWRRSRLAAALAALDPPEGKPMRALADHATIARVPDEDGWGDDCDTWADLERARHRLSEGTAT